MALIGWWQLDDNVNDSSPYKWGSVDSFGTPLYDNAPIGRGLINIGTGAHVAVHTELPSTFLQNGSLTISFWFRQQAGHSTPLNYLFGFNDMYMNHATTTSTWTVTSNFLTATTSTTLTSTVSFNDNQWYHVCIVRDDIGTQYIYVDGVESDKDNATDFVQWEYSDSNFAIGALKSGVVSGEATYVQYSDFKVYNHELSLKEIKELSKGKMFHIDFEDSVDNIAGRVLTGSRAANTGYYHTGTGSNDDFIGRVGDSIYTANGNTNALIYDGANSVIQYDQSASGHTFAFWINEKDYTSPLRQNPFNKAYAGEGTLTLEFNTGNYYKFFWGTAGNNTTPYSTAQSPNGMHEDDVWHHTAIVRDPVSQKVYWYLDGQFQGSPTPTPTWYDAIAGTLDFYLFDGYTNTLNGYLDDFRIYATTLSQYDIQELYQTKAYLTDYGQFISKGNVMETDFYYGFNGYIPDTIAFDVNLGAGTWIWGAPTGSRETLKVVNDTDAWDVNITTKRKFNRPATFYGSVQIDWTARVVIGWKDNGTGIADTDYVHSLIFNNTTGFLSASEDGTIILPNPAIYLSRSIWYDFKMTLGETESCIYQYKDPQVHKEWQDISVLIVAPKSENTLRPAFTHYDGTIGNIEKSWHDNWAITSLDSQVTYYGNIISNEINEVGHTDNLKAMWSLDYTTASYTSTEGDIYVLTSSADSSSPIYGIGPDRINGCALLNWTGSDGVERLNHNIINFENGSQWTAMCWIYPSGSKVEFDLLGLSGSNTKTLGTNASGRPFYQHTGSTLTETSLVLTAGVWNHIAWAQSPTGIFFMLNGIRGVGSFSSSPSCSFNCIGMGGNAVAEIFQGKISDVRIYDVVLTEADITQIYHLEKPTGSLMVSGSSDRSVYFSRDFIEGY